MGNTGLDNGTEEIKLSTGERVHLPLRYSGCSCIHAGFSVRASKVQQLLPSTKLKPLLLAPGAAIISLMGIEYPHVTDIAPYNEFLVGTPVEYEPGINFPGKLFLFNPLISPGRYKKWGMYIFHLPVTTHESVTVGKEIWGFPKFKAEINHTRI